MKRATGGRDRRPSPYPRPAVNAQANKRRSLNRRRVIGGVSALAVAGAVAVGFMGASTAIADGAKDEVVFSGGCHILSSSSEPDKQSMTITQGDSVKFSNNLGTDADLVIGNTTKSVADGSSATIELNDSVEAIMKPHCTADLKQDFTKTTITAKPAEDKPGGSHHGGGSGGGSNGGGTHHSGGGDGGSSDHSSKPGAPGSGDKPAASGHGGDPNKKDGKKPSDDSSASDDSGAAGTSDDSGSKDGKKHIEAVDASQNGGGASGMLAVLAAVCLAGVGFAAVRTAVNSRSSASA